MAISFNTGTTAVVSASGTPSGTVAIPAGVLAGDTILVLVWVFTTATGTLANSLTSTATAPVQVGASKLASGSGIQALGTVYSVAAGASDHGATLTFSTTGGTGGSYWFNTGLVAYTGAGGVDVSSGTSFFASGTGTTTTPSAVTTQSGDWQVQLLGVGPPGGNTVTTPAGLTSREAIPNNSGLTLEIADSNGSAGGSGTTVGNTTWTYSGGTGNVWSASFTVALQPPVTSNPAGRAQPRATVALPRRKAARAVQAAVRGLLNAHGGNGQVQPKPVIARRAAARALVRFTPVSTVNSSAPIPPTIRLAHGLVTSRRPVGGLWAGAYTPQPNASGPSGTVQPRAAVPVPRRAAARAVWRGPAAVRTTNAPPAVPPGTVQPRAALPVPRRTAARALWQRQAGPANAHGPAGTVQPRAAIPVPRRYPGRAVWHLETGSANASGPTGAVQPRATVPVPRRTAARALWRALLGALNASGPSGSAQPRATVAIPRRYPSRAVMGSVLGPANAHGGSGSTQPHATVPVPRRQSARGTWRGQSTPQPHVPGSVQPHPLIARRPSARASWRGTVVSTVNAAPPAPVNGTVQPHVIIGRRAAARAVLHGTPPVAVNARPVPSGTVQPRAAVAIPRRAAARVIWRGNAAPGRQPQAATGGTVRRRSTARGLWHGAAGTPAPAPVPGTPSAGGRIVTRRPPSRGQWHGNAGPVNAHGPAVAAPRMRPRVTSRPPARAVWAGTASRTADAGRDVLFATGAARLPWSTGRARTPWAAGGARTPWTTGRARNE